jgi:hypothetical protein
MATAARNNPPSWFRLVAIVATLWNAMGVFMYLHSVGVFGDPTAELSAAERVAAESIPPAVMAAFAIGTFAGLIGSLGLLLRKRWAFPVLLVSLTALVVLEGWIVFLSGHRQAFGLTFPILVTSGALLLAWLASHAGKRSWLG